LKTYHLIIKGRVFGIGFRFFAHQRSIKYKITGTVSNVHSRDYLEIFCQGKADDVEKFVQEMRKGPTLSRIDSFNIEIIDQDKYDDFRIINT
jgi:acylphosphatase